MTDTTNVTCQDCTYWIANKNAIGPGGEIQLQRIGTCVCMPPTPIMVNQAGNIGFTSVYPIVPGNYPACGEFEESFK